MKPKRGLALVVCILLAMAFPSSALVYGEGVSNGGFEDGDSTWLFDYWNMQGNQATDSVKIHSGSRACCVSGSNAFLYEHDCIVTTNWEGTVEVSGWVWMNDDDTYDASNGLITLNLFSDSSCEGAVDSSVDLVKTGGEWVGEVYWIELGTVIDFSDGGPGSMSIDVFGKGDEGVCFDDIDATSQTTAVTFTELRASANTAKAALMVAVLVATAVYYYWTWRFR
jgi:hypothetical protein